MYAPVAPDEHARRMTLYAVEGVSRRAIYNWRAHRRLGLNEGSWAGVPMEEALPPAGCQLVSGFLRCLVAYSKQVPAGQTADVGRFIREWRKQKYGVVRGKWVGMRTMRV